MADLGEETKTTVRLSEEDRKNIDKIVASGAASNTAEAIRVALADAARTMPMLKAIERRLKEIPPNPMGGYALEQLIELVKTDGVDRLAQEELLRRGYFPDGRGRWVPVGTPRVSAGTVAASGRLNPEQQPVEDVYRKPRTGGALRRGAA